MIEWVYYLTALLLPFSPIVPILLLVISIYYAKNPHLDENPTSYLIKELKFPLLLVLLYFITKSPEELLSAVEIALLPAFRVYAHLLLYRRLGPFPKLRSSNP